MILTDTDVFTEALKNNHSTVRQLRAIGFENIALSAITLMELYYGARNKKEVVKIRRRLNTLKIVHIDTDISRVAVDLVEKYAKSHGLRIPDALIAATALCQHMVLLSYNVKDFKFIEGLRLYHSTEYGDFEPL